MSNTNDGGAAFPYVVQNDSDSVESGISVRDYFAAKALQGMIAHHGNCYPESGAVDAYKWADAMLLAREN